MNAVRTFHVVELGAHTLRYGGNMKEGGGGCWVQSGAVRCGLCVASFVGHRQGEESSHRLSVDVSRLMQTDGWRKRRRIEDTQNAERQRRWRPHRRRLRCFRTVSLSLSLSVAVSKTKCTLCWKLGGVGRMASMVEYIHAQTSHWWLGECVIRRLYGVFACGVARVGVSYYICA